MMKLETGVMLCRMAQLLVAQAQNLGRPILNRASSKGIRVLTGDNTTCVDRYH